MSYIREPARTTSVAGEYDVLVIGGGVAGVSAALSASRAGAKTALVERTSILGGLATGGLILVYTPMCDGRGTRLIGGLGYELLQCALRYGPARIPAVWEKPASKKERAHRRFSVSFNPASLALGLDDVLIRADVAILLETVFVLPLVSGGSRVTGAVVEDRSGRKALRAAVVIDATGDACVASRAGAPVRTGKNFLAMWSLWTGLESSRRATGEGDPRKIVFPLTCGPNPSSAPPDLRTWDATDAHQATRFNLEARELVRRAFREKNAGVPPEERIFPVHLPSLPQFRTTRRIIGRRTLKMKDRETTFPDAIGMTGDWRRAGSRYSIPYGALVPRKIDGLLAAGRIISTTTAAWEVTRVIPPCAVTGQAAGTAAALAARRRILPRDIPTEDLRGALTKAGVILSA